MEGKKRRPGGHRQWAKLLKFDANYEHNDTVEKLIAEAKAHTGKTLLHSK